MAMINDSPSLVSSNSNVYAFEAMGRQKVSNEMRAAEVVAIDLNPDRPESMGRLRFRYVDESGRAEDSLNWAYPLNPYVKTYPVLHELVTIIGLHNKVYWTSIIGVRGFINNNYILEIAVANKATSGASKNYKESAHSAVPNSSQKKVISVGKTFKDRKLYIGYLKPNEGDVIIEGRFGNGIRLGNNPITNSPNIILSLTKHELFGLKSEDFDNGSIISMTTDEPLLFSSIGPSINQDNSPPALYDGNMISLLSDRILIGARQNEILMFSNKSISLACNKNFSVDSESSVGLKSQTAIKMTSPKISIGEGADNPMVLGKELVDVLRELVTALSMHVHKSPMEPPVNSSAIQNVSSKLSKVLSEIGFVK